MFSGGAESLRKLSIPPNGDGKILSHLYEATKSVVPGQVLTFVEESGYLLHTA